MSSFWSIIISIFTAYSRGLVLWTVYINRSNKTYCWCSKGDVYRGVFRVSARFSVRIFDALWFCLVWKLQAVFFFFLTCAESLQRPSKRAKHNKKDAKTSSIHMNTELKQWKVQSVHFPSQVPFKKKKKSSPFFLKRMWGLRRSIKHLSFLLSSFLKSNCKCVDEEHEHIRPYEKEI